MEKEGNVYIPLVFVQAIEVIVYGECKFLFWKPEISTYVSCR